VEDLLFDKQEGLIWFDSETSLRNALQTLESNNVLSAPVLDRQVGSFLGFVDVLDIAGYILYAWNHYSSSLTSDNWRERNYARNEFFDTQVKEILNFSRMDASVAIPKKAPVRDLIRLFCDPKRANRQHRMGVLDENSKLINVISQSDVVTFASKHLNLLPKRVALHSVKQLGLLHAIVMVRLDSTFYEALQVLYHNRISGIALVDENGRISTNMSASDLRGINQKSFNYFTHSTLNFLSKGTMSGLNAPISCSEETLFPQVIQLIHSNNIHRLYITTGNGIPIGVISMGDIIQLLNQSSTTSD